MRKMEFTPRTKQILTAMLKADRTISAKNLAEKVGVSKRTVQRELEYIGMSLKPYQIQFMSKTGVGIWLEGSHEEKARLLADLQSGDAYDVSNREERRKRLVLEILKDKGLKKLFYYSSKFKVSEATISTDLEAVEEWLNKYDLHVIRKPGSGVAIEGSEESYRKAIKAFINENIDTRLLQEAYEYEPDSLDGLAKSNLGKILDDDVLKRVIRCILCMEDDRIMNLTENSYAGLVIHISIAVNRILKNEIIEKDSGWSREMPRDGEYSLALCLAQELEEEFDIRIPPVEVAYICLHLKGAKHEKIQWDEKKTVLPESHEMQRMVNEMIDVFDPERAYLLKLDDEFIQGLLAHLQPTFIRITHDMNISNPVLEDIKRDCPEVFEKCRRVAEVMGKWIGKEIPEAETGYLAVHFGAAVVRLENRNEKFRKVCVGVVCSSGIGISRLMSSKLEKAFKERVVVKCYGKNDITPYIAGKTDFFVTSIPIDPLDTPAVFVDPLLSASDMEQVRKLVYKYERMPEKKKEETSFSAQLEEINLVAAQINAVIKYMEFFKVDNYITFDELLIAIGEKLSPYRDMGEMIREDLRRRERIASQVFAEFGFALLHTRTKGVIRPGFTVCMTKDLGTFLNPYFKQIRAVFIMLVPDDGNVRINTEIMGHISSILAENDHFLNTVCKGDKEEIRKELSAHLKKFFSKYLSGIQ